MNAIGESLQQDEAASWRPRRRRSSYNLPMISSNVDGMKVISILLV
jgi:hypothetical protein